MVTIHSQAMLSVEPHVRYSFFVERPATDVDHKRDNEKVNGLTNRFIQFFHTKVFRVAVQPHRAPAQLAVVK